MRSPRRPGEESVWCFQGADLDKVSPRSTVDFLCVHLYPTRGKINEAIKTLEGFAAAGKPVVIEETFPLMCGGAEFESFLKLSKTQAAGWVGFYWGKKPEELKQSKTIADAMTLVWLEIFRKGKP